MYIRPCEKSGIIGVLNVGHFKFDASNEVTKIMYSPTNRETDLDVEINNGLYVGFVPIWNIHTLVGFCAQTEIKREKSSFDLLSENAYTYLQTPGREMQIIEILDQAIRNHYKEQK